VDSILSIFLQSIHFKRILRALGVFALILAAGAAGYLLIGPPTTTVVDAVYMTFVTISTIGYHEVVDLQGNPTGRIFTMIVALVGIADMTFMLSTFTAFVLETDLDKIYRRRRMQTDIDRCSGHYIVCGAGRVGSYVISELRNDHRKFVVIEAVTETIARHRESDPDLMYCEGDASDDDVLFHAGIARAAGVFAVTGDDSKNLVISLSAKQLNPSVRVVARIHDPRNAAKTLRAGADEIVSPDFTGGHRIASLMIRPQMVSLVDELLRSGGELNVEEVALPPGSPVSQVGALGHSSNWLLVALRQGDAWRFNPSDGHRLEAGNALVVIANPQGKRELETRVAANGR
jgi:voltage-gated potassium channel